MFSSSRQTIAFHQWLGPLFSFAIFMITTVTFAPALGNGFVNWDDDWNLLENLDYRGLDPSHVRWMFTSVHTGHYQPLTWLTFGIDYTLWGMNPLGYHLGSLLLHGANAVLVYFISQRLLSLALAAPTRSLGLKIGAGFASLFFALHPLRVESVAWITERRDVLSGFFLLAALLCYLRNHRQVGAAYWRGLTAALVFYALSLLSKATGIGLPIVLLVLDVYPLRRFVRNRQQGIQPGWLWLEKLPFLLLAVGAGAIALYAQQEARALRSFADYGLAGRLAQAVFGVTFYLWKTIAPQNLSPLYAIPVDFNPSAPEFLVSALIVILVSGALFFLRKRWPGGLASWICYGVILAPVSGFAQSGPQIAADRYTYITCIPWAILAGAAIYRLRQACLEMKLRLPATLVLHAFASILLIGLAWLTWNQVHFWRNSETLWRHALSTGYESGLAHNNLGVVLFEQSKPLEAIAHFRRALEISEVYADGHFNLAKVLESQGDSNAAVRHFSRAAELNPSNAAFQAKLGLALAQQGVLDQAKEHLQKAIKLNPADAKAHNNLGNVLSERGENQEAIQEFRRALQLDPTLQGVQMNLAIALMLERRLDEAASHFQAMLKLQPSFAPAIFYLGVVAGAQGDFTKAIENFRRVVDIQPEFADAHAALARALARQGKTEEAIKHYQRALALMKLQRDKRPPQ